MFNFSLKKFLILASILTLGFSAKASAAIVVDGLVSDWGVAPGAYGASDWTPNSGAFFAQEDQNPAVDYLNPGWGGQSFDVEALYFKREADFAYFAVISGFPLEGRVYQGGNYYAGDFAIDFGSNGSYDFGVETSGANQGKLYGTPTWQNPLFTICGPYALAGGTLLGDTTFAYDKTTYIGTGHYAFEFSIPISLFGSFWTDSSYVPNFTAKWTMSCGNDCLDLNIPNVPHSPEPATAVMMMLGLSGLAFSSVRKKFFLQK